MDILRVSYDALHAKNPNLKADEMPFVIDQYTAACREFSTSTSKEVVSSYNKDNMDNREEFIKETMKTIVECVEKFQNFCILLDPLLKTTKKRNCIRKSEVAAVH